MKPIVIFCILLSAQIFTFAAGNMDNLNEMYEKQISSQFNLLIGKTYELKLEPHQMESLLKQICEKDYGIIEFPKYNLRFYAVKHKAEKKIYGSRSHISSLPDTSYLTNEQKIAFNDSSVKVKLEDSFESIQKHYMKEYIDISYKYDNPDWKVVHYWTPGIQIFLNNKTDKIFQIVLDKFNESDFLHSIHKGDKLSKVIELYGEPLGRNLTKNKNLENLYFWPRLLFQVYEKKGTITDFQDQYEWNSRDFEKN